MVAYLIYANFTIKQSQTLAKLAEEEVFLKNELVVNYQLLKSVPLYEAKIPELERLESSVEQQFPSSDELPNLLIQINQLAEDSDVSILSFTPMNQGNPANATVNTDKDVKISTESFSLNLTANYPDFVKLIYAIAKLPRVIEVDDVKISRLDDKKVSVTLRITIFYRG